MQFSVENGGNIKATTRYVRKIQFSRKKVSFEFAFPFTV